jgi:hypothetical protein
MSEIQSSLLSGGGEDKGEGGYWNSAPLDYDCDYDHEHETGWYSANSRFEFFLTGPGVHVIFCCTTGESSRGKTQDSGSWYRGSNPCSPATATQPLPDCATERLGDGAALPFIPQKRQPRSSRRISIP